MSATKDQLAKLQNELERPLPTPVVGRTVRWYDRAIHEKDAGRAAVVTQVLGPGKINLTIFPPNSIPIHKTGVLHKADPMHQKRNNSVSVNCGSWDYLEGETAPKGDFAMHEANLRGRIKSCEAQIDLEEKIKNPPKSVRRVKTGD